MPHDETQHHLPEDALRSVRVPRGAWEEGPRETFQVQEVGCHLRVSVPDSTNQSPETYLTCALERSTPTDSPGLARREQFSVKLLPPNGARNGQEPLPHPERE